MSTFCRHRCLAGPLLGWVRVRAWLLLLVMMAWGLPAWAGAGQPGRFIAPADLRYEGAAAALAGFDRGEFAPMTDSPVAYGYGEAPIWMVVVPSEAWPGSGPMFLSINPLPISQVTFWLARPGGELFELGRNGMSVPGEQRATRTRLATVMVPEVRDVSGLLLLKVEPISVRVVGLTLRNAHAQQQWTLVEGLAIGVALCLMACLFGVAFLIYTLLQQRTLAEWALALIIVSSLLVAVNGIMRAPLEMLFKGYFNEVLIVLAAATIINYSLTALPHFSVPTALPRGVFWVRLSIWMVLPAGIVGYVWGGSGLAGVFAWHTLQVPVMVGLGVWRVWVGDRSARRYALHGALILGAVLWLYLGLSGWVEFHMSHWVLWQVALALTFLSWLVDLLMSAWREREANALERERLHHLLTEEKQQLAARVEERTAELREALAEVQRFESHQRELLSLASHEFRTPAAMIKSAMDVLACLPEDYSEAARTRLETVRSASNRLIFLANKLIEHDRWRELSVKPNKVQLDLRAWMLDVMSDFPPETPVMVRAGDAVLHIQGDAVLLRIALQNLVDNALSHTKPTDGVVVVALHASQGWVHVTVDDDGPGVPDDTKAKVFDRFFSGRRTQRHGLGLSIVRAVARLHGGDAAVSDAPGRGARFVISLPLVS
ncbi:MAG: ATP-binding protein [Ideonella sp.]|nr:ATP-binding protein [Ideonella sp.]